MASWTRGVLKPRRMTWRCSLAGVQEDFKMPVSGLK
jgi:hypothetical protein